MGQIAYYDSNGNSLSGTSTLFLTQAGNIQFGSSTVASSIILDYDVRSTSTIPDSMNYAWSIATGSTAVPIFTINTSGSGQYATSSFMGGFDGNSGAINYDYSGNRTSIERLQLGNVKFQDDAGWVSWIDMTSSSSASGDPLAYSAQINAEDALTVYSKADGSGGITNLRVVVGSSTDAILGSNNIPYGSLIVSNGVICLDDGGATANTCASSARTTGKVYSSGTDVTSLDLAENYPTKDSDLSAGDLLMFDPLHSTFVTKFDIATTTRTRT